MNNPIRSRFKVKIWKWISLLSLLLGLGVIAGAWLHLNSNAEQSEAANHQVKERYSSVLDKPKPKEVPPRTDVLYPIRPKFGDTIGMLRLPTVGKNLPVIHGTHEDKLEKGVRHHESSVLPGEKDNSVLSGYRDTVFRELGKIKQGDPLVVQTSAGTFTYVVKDIRIVAANDRSIIDPADHAMLTVSTWYPFDHADSAPQRYILIADLIMSKLKIDYQAP
jgi:sortase A